MPNARLPFYERPEYFFISRIERLCAKYPDIPELKELLEDGRLILSQNSRYIMQSAYLEVMGGHPDELTPEIREFLKNMFAGALMQLRNEDGKKTQ